MFSKDLELSKNDECLTITILTHRKLFLFLSSHENRGPNVNEKKSADHRIVCAYTIFTDEDQTLLGERQET